MRLEQVRVDDTVDVTFRVKVTEVQTSHLNGTIASTGAAVSVSKDKDPKFELVPPDNPCLKSHPVGATVRYANTDSTIRMKVSGYTFLSAERKWVVNHVGVNCVSDGWDFASDLVVVPDYKVGQWLIHPEQIEVGDWWADEGGWPCVVVKIGPTGNPFLRRWTSEHPDKAPSPETLRAAWTRLDGPPEPPVGSVYVIRGTVWESTNEGHWRVGMEGVDLWPEAQAYYDKVDLATLQIVHTLGVE